MLPQGASRLPPEDKVPASESDIGRGDLTLLPGDDGSILVVGLGSINLRKGVDCFIATAASVQRLKPSRKVAFAWIGKCSLADLTYFDYLTEHVRRANVASSFVFAGEFEDLAPIYARADICLLSSRLDPLPNIAIDAAIHAIPIVCFDQASGVADILTKYDETRELVVPYLDAEAAAGRIVEMADDPKRLSAFSTAMRDIVSKHFDMARYGEAIESLGLEAAHSSELAMHSYELITSSGRFNARLYLGAYSPTISTADAIKKYLLASRLAAPRARPRTHLLVRRPLEGFHPLVYASDNHEYDEASGEDPLAHYIRTGSPAGRWRHEIIRPHHDKSAQVSSLKVAVHGHFHYPELLEDFLGRLRRNRTAVDLILTTTSEERARTILEIISRLEAPRATVTVVPNRGRDIGPLLTQIGYDTLAGYDVIGHFHGKKSAHKETQVGEIWRNFLWEHLVGKQNPMMDVVLEAFASDATLGLVFPEDPHLNDWDDNRAIADALATRMGLAQPLPNHFDFPNGTMFWARPKALKPLMNLGLAWEDYPVEPLPNDGTLPHALESLIPFSAIHAGYRYASTYVEEFVR